MCHISTWANIRQIFVSMEHIPSLRYNIHIENDFKGDHFEWRKSRLSPTPQLS